MRKETFLFYLFILLIVSCKQAKVEKEYAQEEIVTIGFHDIDFKTIFKPYENHSDKDGLIKLKIKEYFQHTWEGKNLSGGLLVARGNNVLFERYRGYSDIKDKKEITASTPLHIASISKIFTSLVILKLAENDELKLEQKVTDFFPKFPYKDISIKDLLSHRSGLPNYEYLADNPEIWNKSINMMNEDVLNIFIDHQIPLQFTPGTRFAYSNTNFALLALIVEKTTLLPFPQVVEDMIFKPLQMDESFVYQEKDSSKITTSYYAKGSPYPFNHLDKVYGDKNIYSTPRDLFRLSKAMYASNFIRKDLLDMMFTPYSNETSGVKNYGLGMRLMIFDNGKKIVYHTGWWHGNNTIFIHLLDEKVTIIALGNKYSSSIYSVIKLTSLFGEYPYNLDDNEPLLVYFPKV